MKRIPSGRFRSLHNNGFVLPASYDRVNPISATTSPQSYEGAATGLRLGGWRPTGGGPNVFIGSSHAEIRNRVRQQVRDNPRAVSAVDAFTRNVIGCGIRPNWQLEDAGLKKEIHELWGESYCELDADNKNDFYGLQSLVCTGMFESGETLVRMRTRRLSDGYAVPLQLQVMEPDVLNEHVTRNGVNRVEMGIEINPIGERVAYHMFRGHPNDRPTADLSTTRVPVDEIAHVYKVRRPGQLRGISWLAPCLVKLYDLDKGEDALQVLFQVAAMLTGFIRRDTGDESITDLFGEEATNVTDERNNFYESIQGLSPGDLRILAPGDNIEFAKLPDIGPNYQPWLKSSVRTFAAAIGIPYEAISGDMEGVNYSSARVALIECRRGFESIQKQLIVHQFCRPVLRWWMDSAVASGAISIRDYAENRRKYLKVTWVPDAFQFVDPQKEVAADIAELEAGLNSRQNLIRSRSRNIEELDNERSQDQKREKSLGLNQPEPQPAGAKPSNEPKPQSTPRRQAANREY